MFNVNKLETQPVNRFSKTEIDIYHFNRKITMTEESTLTIQLTVTGAQGQPRVPLTICNTITCTELRQQTSEKTKIPLSKLKLIFRGRLVADDDSKAAVKEYKLEEGSVLHCMGKPISDSSASAAAPAAATNTATPPSVVPPAPAIASAARPSPAVAAPPVADPLQAAFQMIRASSSPPDYLTAVTTLDKILGNIVNNPMEEKYRKVKKQNAAFQRRLGGRIGGDAAMKATGFVTQQDEGEEVYMMHASAEAWPKLMAAKATLEAAVRDAKSAANQPTAPPPVVPPVGMPGAFSAAGTMGSPEMQRAAADLMSNPAQLQAMMQNPMVQNMIRNHPQFANNPMRQQMMEQMMNNPQMIAQMSQMMRDPAMMNRMQAMMGGGAGSGGVPNNAVPPAFPQPPANNASNAQQGSSSSGEADEQMTEEEMIAEAIRRSLQDDS